jgi:hypothetical protein
MQTWLCFGLRVQICLAFDGNLRDKTGDGVLSRFEATRI